jgi:excisionase family DNA binding protein
MSYINKKKDTMINKEKQTNTNQLLNANYLNIDQLSIYTGFSKAYLYKLTHLSKIPFYKPNGGKILFSKVEIEQWIADSRYSTKAEIEQNALIYSLKKSA